MASPFFQPLAQLRGQNILLTGSTGFVGKVLFSMLLRFQPEVGHVYCVIRKGKGRQARDRFAHEVLRSPVLEPVRAMLGEAYEPFVEQKVTVIESNLSSPDLGLPESELAGLRERLDLILHCAGNTDFTPPLRDSLASNTLGVRHLMGFARSCAKVKFLHISTCYVTGLRDGLVPEDESLDIAFPAAEANEGRLDPVVELEQALRRDAEVDGASRDQVLMRKFRQQALEHLEKEHIPAFRADLLEKEVEKCRHRWVEEELRRVGEERAKMWGWPNTYTYSKGLAEKILVSEAAHVPWTIVRPAIIESAVAYPQTGWNEGVNTSAPLIYLTWRGLQNLPTRPGLRIDFIPVDHIASGVLMAAGALLAGRAKKVYHLGTSECNPIEMERIIELTSLAHRKMRRKDGSQNLLEKIQHGLLEIQPGSIETFNRISAPAVHKLASGLKGWLGGLSAPSALKPVVEAAKTLATNVEKQSRVVQKAVHTFMPYIHDNNYRFRSKNILELRDSMDPAERAILAYEPDRIEWRTYWTDVHVPGLHKFTLPELEEKLRKKPRHIHAYADLRELFLDATERYADSTALQLMTAKGIERVRYRELRVLSERGAARLKGLGAAAGDRVLILSENRPEWAATYFAITLAGATAVPVDPNIDLPTLEKILASSRTRLAVVSNKTAQTRGQDLKELLIENNCERVSFDDLFLTLEEEKATRLEQGSALHPPGTSPLDPVGSEGASRVASLIYTSGTTGTPKGVRLTQANFTGLLNGLLHVFFPLEKPRFVSVLPLHHTFEFTCGLLTPIARGGQITYLEEINAKQLARAFGETRMTHMVGVPALWQMLARNIEARFAERGPRAEKLLRSIVAINRKLSRSTGVNLGPVLLAPVHRFFGGRQPLLISGGAALPEDVLKTFEGLGLKLLEGYGLTEAAPVLAVNSPSRKTLPGSVGRAVPGVELRVHESDEHGVGEILARSPGVMDGYEGLPDETARVLQGGWLHTGDLGSIDRKGHVRILGRKKDLILDASGENIYPDELEELYSASFIQEISVVGLPDGKGGEKAAALLVAEDRERALGHIDAVALGLPRHKRLHLIRFTEQSLPRTATRKIKRGEVVKLLQSILDAEKSATPAASAPRRGSSGVWAAISRVSGRPTSELHEGLDFILDLGLDSLQFLELHAQLASAGVHIPAHDAKSLRTIANVLDYLHPSKTGGQGPSAPGGARGEAPTSSSSALVRLGAPPQTPPGTGVPGSHGAAKLPADLRHSAPLPEPVAEVGRKLLRGAREALFGGVLEVKVLGRAHIPQSGRFIAIANHTSHLDTGIVLHALGDAAHGMVTLAARDYFFDTPLKERLARQLTNLLPLDRTGSAAESLDEAGKALDAGHSLLIFPEGTRSKSGKLAEFKPGIGILALQHRMDILPLHIEGSHEILPKGAVLPRGRRVTVRIGTPIAYRSLAEQTQGQSLGDASKSIAKLAEAAVARLSHGVFRAEDEAAAQASHKKGLQSVLDEMLSRFRPSEVEQPIAYYLSLGEQPDEKWTLRIEKAGCTLAPGKDGAIDCVLKTSVELFSRIVRERYTPDMEDFMTGRVKTNELGLLMAFQKIFDLS